MLLISIIRITFRSYIEYRLLQKESIEKQFCNTLLFTFGLLFNIAAFFCIFSLFYKAFIHITPDKIVQDHNLTGFSQIPLLFPCNLVFLQNTFLMIVLFIRIYYIFYSSPFKVTSKTIIKFAISLLISSGIFIILLTTKIRIPGTDSWLNCAVTLCIFNIIFAIWITSLFLKKLTMTLKMAYSAANIDNKRKVRKQDMAFIKTITKTALLSFISMFVTFISCLFLLFRYSIFGESLIVNIISEWLVSINIFCNFACYSLAFRYYDKHYDKCCKKLDKECRSMWLFVVFGDAESDVNILKSIIEPSMMSSKTRCSDTSSAAKKSPISGVSTGDINIVYDREQTPVPQIHDEDTNDNKEGNDDKVELENDNSNNTMSSTAMDIDQVLNEIDIDIQNVEMETI